MVDVIIPYYNSDKTIERALASILMQTIKDKIHVIIVDDKSCESDNLSNIIKKFNKMLDINCIRLRKNSGPGTARRKGMLNCTSKYLMFMDSDDTFYSAFSIEHLVNEMEKHEDMSAISSWFLEELEGDNIFSRHENDSTWVFGKIYRRDFLETNKIYFNDTRSNEDSGFNAVVFNHGKHAELQEVTYIWHFNPKSITRINDNIYTFTCVEHYLYNMSWAIQKLQELCEDYNKICKLATQYLIISYFYALQFYHSEDKRYDMLLFRKWAKKYYKNVYSKLTIPGKMLEETYGEIAKTNASVLTEKIPPMTLYNYIDWIS